MPRVCTVCMNPSVAEINKALLDNLPMRKIAAIYRVSPDAVERHWKSGHLPAAMSHAKEAREVLQADDLLGQLKAVKNKAMSLLLKAERGGDIRTALQGIREARACLELLFELEGELNRSPQFNVLISPQWVQVRTVLVDALQEYPTARAVVAGRLMQLEAGQV